MTLLVTGGADFIGINFVLDWLAAPDTSAEPVITLDALTYAGNRENLASLDGDARHTFVHGDICDRVLVDRLLAEHRPRAIVHFAAESHVDRSIHSPGTFVRTYVEGTFTLLEAARAHWAALPEPERAAFRFHHVSTDEVYGSLGAGDPAFTETHPYQPNSPYSASKAATGQPVQRRSRHKARRRLPPTLRPRAFGPIAWASSWSGSSMWSAFQRSSRFRPTAESGAGLGFQMHKTVGCV